MKLVCGQSTLKFKDLGGDVHVLLYDLRSIREAIAEAIHVVVHLARVNGHRRVTEITEVGSYDASAERFVLSSRMPHQPVAVEEKAPGWRERLSELCRGMTSPSAHVKRRSRRRV